MTGELDTSCLKDIIDYAGLFPPAKLSATDAVAEFLEMNSNSQLKGLFKRFVFPLNRREELEAEFQKHPHQEVPLSLLGQPAPEQKDALATLHLVESASQSEAWKTGKFQCDSLEVKLPSLSSFDWSSEWKEFGNCFAEFRARHPHITLYVEQDWQDMRQVGVDRFASLAQTHGGLCLKIRTGGLTEESIPPPDSLANVLSWIVSSGLALKCTAGLHAALRETSPRFHFEMHGFLNVQACVGLLQAWKKCGKAPNLVLCLETLGAQTLPELTAAVKKSEVGVNSLSELLQNARSTFHSFGSCSVKEPFESLESVNFTNQSGNTPS